MSVQVYDDSSQPYDSATQTYDGSPSNPNLDYPVPIILNWRGELVAFAGHEVVPGRW